MIGRCFARCPSAGAAALDTGVSTNDRTSLPGDIERSLQAAELIAEREAAMAQALRDGKPITDVVGASCEHVLK